MKLIGIVIYLFLLLACTPMTGSPLILKDSVTGEDIDACSSDDEDYDREIFRSIRGECDHVPKPSPLHRVTQQVIDGEVCCVLQILVDHGNGKITPLGR